VKKAFEKAFDEFWASEKSAVLKKKFQEKGIPQEIRENSGEIVVQNYFTDRILVICCQTHL
jgi:hypothetical protein